MSSMACKCGNKSCARISSNVVQSMGANGSCIDVCANPICGDPKMLSIMAPLIYDEIGVNLCATFKLGVGIPTMCPTAVTASAQVLGIDYTCGQGNVQIESIAGRPNCYVVTLTNLKVFFAIKLYDSACRLLKTVYTSVMYLPSQPGTPTYDADTNPNSIELEIFAPYGISYEIPEKHGKARDVEEEEEDAGDTDTKDVEEKSPKPPKPPKPTPIVNNIGFLTNNNTIQQGLNLYAIPKVLGLNITTGTITVGLTLILQSLYYAGYNVASCGKIQTPKGSILTPDNSDCMKFVAGDLLDLKIKPLELGPPLCEENHKEKCNGSSSGTGACNPCNNSCGSCHACNGSACSYFASDNTVAITE